MLTRVVVPVLVALSLAGCGASWHTAAPESSPSSPRRASAEALASWRCSDFVDLPARTLTAEQRYFSASCVSFARELKRHPMTADGFAMTYCHLDVHHAPAWVVINKAACDDITEDLRARKAS